MPRRWPVSIAAVVGGIVAGALGGSPLQVSGPAAGLTVVVASLIEQFGWAVTCAITVAAGVLQVLFGMSRVARAALAVSPVVVHAMLAGIGITIALQQTHVLLGGQSNSSAWRNVVELPGQLANAHGPGLMIGLLVIGVLASWRWLPKTLARVPGPLVAIVLATVLSIVLALDVERVRLDGSLIDALALPGLPDGNWGAFAVGVVTVALIASVESLLSAVSVDRMHSGPRTNFDREMIGQGAANITSGAIGGLPVTGVIVRSTTNVNVGARTRASAILHGVWVLVFALPFAGLAEQIPMAALAGLLIVIGIQLVKRAHIETAHRTGDISVYAVTVVGVVFLNLLEGVLIGLALAVALIVFRVVRTRIHVEPVGDRAWRVLVEGSCSFLSLPRLTKALASVPAETTVIVELSVDFIDHAAHEAIEDWCRQHRGGGGAVEICEVGAVAMQSAVQGPPMREIAALDLRSGVVPWSHWQNGNGSSSYNGGPKTEHRPAGRNGHRGGPEPHGDGELTASVFTGLDVYRRRTAPYLKPHLERLAHAQRPETLFITCTDSRIVPNIITSSGPGDLFTVRNFGNLVPEGQSDTSIEASIAFAVDQLSVSSIVVCGHSSCGAMHALLGGGHAHAAEPLGRWLAHGEATLDAFDCGRHPVARSAADAGFGDVDQLSMVNIATQVDILAAHPLVRRRERLEVVGLFYDIASASVLRVLPDAVESMATVDAR